MRKLRVLVVGDFRPQIGGVARYVEELRGFLLRRGHDVCLFHSSHFGKDVLEKKIFRMQRSPIKLARLAVVGFPPIFIRGIREIPSLLFRPKMFLVLSILFARCKEILSQAKIDVIHSMHLGLRTLACIFAVEKEIPVVVSAHGFDTCAPNSAFEYYLRKLVCQNARAILVQTEIRKKYLKDLFERDFTVVPNFVSASQTFFGDLGFNDGHELLRQKSKAKRQLGYKDSDILILFASRLVKEKGIYELIRTFEKLISTIGPSARLHLIITGDGPEKEGVIRIIQNNPLLSCNVHFAFDLNYDTLKMFYAASDIMVLPTHLSEAMPMVIIEAMAHGEAVVTSNFKGVEEIINHKQNGLIIFSQGRNSLFTLLYELIEDPDLRTKVSWNAYRTFREKFESELIAAKIEGMYQKCFKSECCRRHNHVNSRLVDNINALGK